jgi:acyl-CoA synthetase (AMP-forming)/AMP-acid ligase II
MNTAELFLKQARLRPDAPAIIETRNGKDRVLTFRELDDLSARGAALLRWRGLRSGDTALVFQPMSIDLYVALASLFRAGIVAMFLDPSAGRAHIAQCCALRSPDAFLGSPKAHLLRIVSPEIRRIPRHFAFGGWPIPGAVSWTKGLRQIDPSSEVEPCAPDTPALLTFTSGSTGQPKAAVRTHALLHAQHSALEESIHLQAGQMDLTTLPIFALANLASGVTSLIPEGDLRRPDAIRTSPIVRQIRRHRPSRCGASPAFFERLLSTRESFPEFTELYTGGAPVFPVLLDRMRNAARKARVVAVYGSTEAEPIAHIARDEMSREDILEMVQGGGLLTGVPESCVELRILRDHWGEPVGPFTAAEFAAECAPSCATGEIVVSGAHVLPGYLNGQGDAETKFRVDGKIWHRTGDCGYLDITGRLHLLGRANAKIMSSARATLYPFAVECAAREQPGVRRAALAEHNGKRILLIEPEKEIAPNLSVVLRVLAWAELDDIRLWCRIPMDRRHNAKVDYAELKKRLDRGG